MTDLLDGNGMNRDDLVALATVIGHSDLNGSNPLKPIHTQAITTKLVELAGKAEPGDVFALSIRKVTI